MFRFADQSIPYYGLEIVTTREDGRETIGKPSRQWTKKAEAVKAGKERKAAPLRPRLDRYRPAEIKREVFLTCHVNARTSRVRKI